LLAALDASGFDVAFGADGSISVTGGNPSTDSSGGNFETPLGGIGDGLNFIDLLPPTDLAFGTLEDRELFPPVPEEDEETPAPELEEPTPENLLPTLDVSGGSAVDESALSDGTNPSSPNEATAGTFAVGEGDGLSALIINGVDVTNGGTIAGRYGTLTVTGNPNEGYSWSYTLVDNTIDHPARNSTGTSEGISDIFTVTVVDSNGDQVSQPLTIAILDDGPIAISNGAGIHAGVVEDALSTISGDAGDKSNGNLDAGQTTSSDEASGGAGSLNGLFTPGADGPLTFSLNPNISGLPTLFSHGEQLAYSVVGNVLTASTSFGTVFTLTVNTDGSWLFDLDDQLDHVAGSGDTGTLLRTSANGSTSVPAIDFSSIIVATDGDGDSVVGGASGGFTITVQNDVPIALTQGGGVQITVAEDALSASLGDAGDKSEGNLDAGRALAAMRLPELPDLSTRCSAQAPTKR